MDRRGLIAAAGALALSACTPQSQKRSAAEKEPDLFLNDLEARHGGRLGVAALDVGTGRRVLWRGQERFPFCSTFKAFLAVAVLERVQRNEERLDRQIPVTAEDMIPHAPTTGPAVGYSLSVRQLLQAMVELSDNPAANILIRELGGLAVWRQWWPPFGDTTTLISRLEPDLNTAEANDPRDTCLPAQTLTNVREMAFSERLSPEHDKMLADWLTTSPTGPNRIKAAAPEGWTVAHKTGTGQNGTANDVAMLTPVSGAPVILAVYFTGAVQASDDERDADGLARPTGKEIMGWLAKGEVLMAVGVIGVIMLLIVPVPKMLLDLLLAVSIVSSVLILMTAVMMKRPLDFAIFPTVLLVSTLYRLGLNLASTRLILTHGQEGHDSAGQVIAAFGELMMGGNFIIGMIIFAIILVVNFVVITKGSTRIAEVSARFTLDSMPGKQMAIDADLSSGLITEDQAKIRRKELEQESTFFGAMDGASKFVRGDAVAGLIITFINAIGGLLIGITQHGMPAMEAANTYVQLTVGDGLVTQIPAIIISIAAGFLVSKAGVEGTADKALVSQLATNPVSLGVVSGAAGLIGLIPGMPLIPFAALALGSGFMAWRLGRQRLKPQPSEAEIAAAAAAGQPKEEVEEPISNVLTIDEVKIELGYSLLSLINDLEGRRLTDQIKALRRSLAQEYGFVMPQVRILDNMRLPTQGYSIRIKEMDAGAGEVRLGHLMAMDPAGRQVELPGEHMREPAFGLPATWINENLREEATFHGYTLVDPSTVLTTHLTEILKENMADLLSYGEVQKLLKELGPEEKKLVEELVPSVVTVTTLQRVLQALLREKVSIRDLPAILEGLAEAAPHSTSVTTLVEHVRARLGRQLCWQHQGGDGALPIVTLSPEWEAAFSESLIGGGEDKQLAMAPSRLQDFIRSVRDTFERIAMSGENPVLLTGPHTRPYVRSIIERFRGQTVVMSQNEIHPRAKLRTLGQV
ncbi:hypothetical protein LTR94_024137 [Friedmanniomyces endolithicus]|nr:hypothetical protein LTR94_024137 [Friedmanniomyces endolithicus]